VSTPRADGRAADALRPVRFERHAVNTADGACIVHFGDTRVLCTASLSDRVPGWMRDSGQGWVTAEYAMLPGSSRERIQRDHIHKGRAQEISRFIGRVLRAVTDRDAMGECLVTVDCDVLQADGGTRTAAVTGGYIALYDAFAASVARGLLGAVPLHTTGTAISVGICGGAPVLDLCYAEDSAASVDLNVAMDGKGGIIEVQGCAEGAPFARTELDAMLDLAAAGNAALARLQREALGLG